MHCGRFEVEGCTATSQNILDALGPQLMKERLIRIREVSRLSSDAGASSLYMNGSLIIYEHQLHCEGNHGIAGGLWKVYFNPAGSGRCGQAAFLSKPVLRGKLLDEVIKLDVMLGVKRISSSVCHAGMIDRGNVGAICRTADGKLRAPCMRQLSKIL